MNMTQDFIAVRWCDVPVSIVNALKRTVRTHGHLDAALSIQGRTKAQTGNVYTAVDKSAGLVDWLGTKGRKHIELKYTHRASLETDVV